MVEFPNGVQGLAFNLDENSVGVIILGDYLAINEGDEVRALGRLLSVPVGEAVLGRVLDPLGNPLDGKGPVETSERRPVELIATGIAERQPVKESLQTGLKAVDAMTPIGRGQRELIIGDRKTGKTAIALDAIVNQRDSGVKCFYVAIGQKDSSVAGVIAQLEKHGAMEIHHGDRGGSQFALTAPVRGAVRRHGDGGVLHVQRGPRADRVRRSVQASCGLSRIVAVDAAARPGAKRIRGTCSIVHSRLLERSAKLSKELGGGSLTSLPIIETLEGEVSAYIPTNVISITRRADLSAAGLVLRRTAARHERGYFGVAGGWGPLKSRR